MEQYHVTGMSCAACSARVEKAVLKVDGVTFCSVNLLTNSMGVEGSAGTDEIVKAVEGAGYGAEKMYQNRYENHIEKRELRSDREVIFVNQETMVLKKRLVSSLIFLMALMYFSMGHMMWNLPLPSFFDENHVAMGLVQLLLAAIVMIINQKFFISGVKSLVKGAPNMDTLVALGSSASLIYSTYALFAMTDAQVKGNKELVISYMHEFYFESAAMILTLITVGKLLEAYSKGKTTDALKGLMKLAPKTATLVKDGIESEVAIEQVKIGDIFVVRPGKNIPVDGVVTEGESAVNESALTGESIPVDKASGDAVYAATLNQSGFLRCRATRVGEDTSLSQIIQMVSNASATKAPIAKIADRVSGVFVPVVMLIAGITIAVWLFAGYHVGFALARGISVLVISCPCALGLATPVAIMVGNGVGAKSGILFKNAMALEETGKIQIVALDKTGTITNGEPKVTDVIAGTASLNELLLYANSLEKMSEHPLAKAITGYAKEKGIDSLPVDDFMALPGNGLKAVYHREELFAGNYRLIQEITEVPDEMKKQADLLAESGKTPLYFVKKKQLLGIIAVADVIKEDSKEAVEELKKMGMHVVMITGDHEKTAKAIGNQVGVDEVIAGVLPDGKEKVIRDLQKNGKVIMVGDGINDAPALTRAEIGIAIGTGTDIAIDAADVVLMKSSLVQVPAAIRLSRKTLQNIHQNLFWAFFYNMIGIPLAAGVFLRVFGWKLNPMFGASAMSLSSFFVVTNALRLNLVKIYDSGKDKGKKKRMFINRENNKKSNQKMEDFKMQKTIKIEGMMCAHCEATVKKALEGLDQVEKADVSHEKGTAIVSLNAELDHDILKKTVEDKDYKVIGIE
ncbi:MAG: heavy metal translocating P-type ATPase [Lachnospiraceae bacterium]|nr:heavy metal translocating P-type ATPase [Lachnospiraceae bacterium]